MKPDNEMDDKRFFGRLRVEKPERFWSRQRGSIMRAVELKRARPARRPAWALAPAFAALFLGAAWLVRHEGRKPVITPPEASAAMLDNLDMLDDMELLESIPDKELI